MVDCGGPNWMRAVTTPREDRTSPIMAPQTISNEKKVANCQHKDSKILPLPSGDDGSRGGCGEAMAGFNRAWKLIISSQFVGARPSRRIFTSHKTVRMEHVGITQNAKVTRDIKTLLLAITPNLEMENDVLPVFWSYTKHG